MGNLMDFIGEVIDSYHLNNPAIVYDSNEEAPEICYTRPWVLCLPSHHSVIKSDGSATEPGGKLKESATEQATHFKGGERKLLTSEEYKHPMNLRSLYEDMLATLLGLHDRGECF